MLAESGPNLIPIVVIAVLVAGFAGYFIVRGRSRGGTAPTDITDAEIARASVPETVIDSIPEVAAPVETIVEPAPAMLHGWASSLQENCGRVNNLNSDAATACDLHGLRRAPIK